jgi:hypothetical protein
MVGLALLQTTNDRRVVDGTLLNMPCIGAVIPESPGTPLGTASGKYQMFGQRSKSPILPMLHTWSRAKQFQASVISPVIFHALGGQVWRLAGLRLEVATSGLVPWVFFVKKDHLCPEDATRARRIEHGTMDASNHCYACCRKDWLGVYEFEDGFEVDQPAAFAEVLGRIVVW